MRREEVIHQKDHLLVQEVLAGNEKVFKELVQKHEPMVARVCISMLGNSADADDVGQETFIRFYRSLEQFKGESSLATYLTRIAINLSLNEIKRRKNRSWLVFNNPIDNRSVPFDESKKKDRNELVDAALSRLEPSFRSVVVLRYIQGYSTKETAKILKVPLGTVLSRLSRAQKKLKEIITVLEK